MKRQANTKWSCVPGCFPNSDLKCDHLLHSGCVQLHLHHKGSLYRLSDGWYAWYVDMYMPVSCQSSWWASPGSMNHFLPTSPFIKKRNEHCLLIKSSPMKQPWDVTCGNECASSPTYYWFTMWCIVVEPGSVMPMEISFLDILFLFAVVIASCVVLQ